MYHYIVDLPQTSAKNFDNLLGQIHGYLTQYQIGGEVHRATRLRNVYELTELALKANAKTVVAIGDDSTFNQVLSMVAEKEGVVMGYVPLIKSSAIGRILGLSDLQDSCKAIAQRRIEEFDLGQVGRNYFFTQIDFGSLAIANQNTNRPTGFFAKFFGGGMSGLSAQEVKVSVDDKYEVSVKTIGGAVVNTRSQSGKYVVGADRRLDMLLVGDLSSRELKKYSNDLISQSYETISGTTVIHGQKFEISGDPSLQFLLNGAPISRLPLEIIVADKRMRLIIGKGRG